MACKNKKEKWFRPMFEFDNEIPSKKPRKEEESVCNTELEVDQALTTESPKKCGTVIKDHKNWIKNFEPVTVEDLAVHNKKIQEVDEWIKSVCNNNNGDILLLTGPVGCGKTITLKVLAAKHNIRVTEWITPLDIDIRSDNGEFEYKQKQSLKFLDFILNAANFISLIDDNSRKLVLVEDFPNTFIRTPSEFTDVLHQYKHRAKSPIVFICSESHSNSKNSAVNIFTPALKEQYQIHHITFNSAAPTNLKSALKRVATIISKKHTTIYTTPTTDVIECVVNSSAGDIRSAVLNLHFACLKGGSKQNMDTSIVPEKETKSKGTKKKKQSSSKFMSLGKDQTVSILHGVGRVLNPKVIDAEKGNQKFTHSPEDIIEQFISQPTSFINFLEENYLSHFSCIDHVERATSALSDADLMLAEWQCQIGMYAILFQNGTFIVGTHILIPGRNSSIHKAQQDKICQELGLYIGVAGLMLANKAPVSAWNPVRGPKNMRIQYPAARELQLEENNLYKGKTLVADYQTYCKIIGSKT